VTELGDQLTNYSYAYVYRPALRWHAGSLGAEEVTFRDASCDKALNRYGGDADRDRGLGVPVVVLRSTSTEKPATHLNANAKDRLGRAWERDLGSG
jgi:hypothetical protein